jgi:23S rRNA (guanine2535-N1)-methyltransferase
VNYKFALENKNYEDFSSGRVLYNQQGTTSFPVRLGSEIFQQCVSFLMEQGIDRPYTLYDPCCGGAYLLTSLGYLHGEHIGEIYASDIDGKVIPLAEKNLSLLSITGLNERIQLIEKMFEDFGKESHAEALQSAAKLKKMLENQNKTIETNCFVSDITEPLGLKEKVNSVDIVITDLPYGDIVQWGGIESEEEAIAKLLENLLQVLADISIVAVISKKKTKVKHDQYKKVEQFNIGKRQVTFLRPA